MTTSLAQRQSFGWWCYANKGVAARDLIAGAAKIGYAGIDLIDESLWPMVRDHGLAICAVGGHTTLENGLNRPANAQRIESELRANIAKAVEWKIPVLICFSGNRDGISDAEGLENCAQTLAKIAPEAEAAGVALAVELLNSKVDHKDYQCDHTVWGVELCKRVNSPAVKLLYDIYHMQIMEGDLIRTIRDFHPYFAHLHTAGSPGRVPMDDTQEIHYPPIYRAIATLADPVYTGYIAHEFMIQGNPLGHLETAYRQVVEALAA